MQGDPVMAVHLIYRSYGGDNRKSRPEWFSKHLAAASFARAAETAGLSVHWLNDGPVPEALSALFRQFGDIQTIAGGPVGMRGSYVTALRLAARSDWPDEDVVYFCEDDYLHRPDALVALQAVAENADVSYVGLHGGTPEYANVQEYPGGFHYPRDWNPQPDIEAGGHRWVHGVSTTSTFGARLGALRADMGVFRQAMFPFRKRFLDHETAVIYQGRYPYHGKEYLLGAPGDFVPGLRGIARAAVLVPVRLGLTLTASRHANSPHLLYIAAPNLATHAELGIMNPGRDWDALAADTRTWALDRGIALPSV